MKHILILFLSLIAAPLGLIAHTYLQVICEPGVEIFLNDTFTGTSNWADGGLHLKISPGDYDLKAKKEGFSTQETSIFLRKSDVKVWELKPFTPLKGSAAKTPSPSELIQNKSGSLIIYSYPNKCTITLVDPSKSENSWLKSMGQWKAQKLPPGKYTVKATAQGKTLSYDIEIPPAGGVELIFNFRAGKASLRSVFNNIEMNEIDYETPRPKDSSTGSKSSNTGDPRVIEWIRQADIRSSSRDNQILVNGRSYEVNDIVNAYLGIQVRLVQKELSRVLLTDPSGTKYLKTIK